MPIVIHPRAPENNLESIITMLGINRYNNNNRICKKITIWNNSKLSKKKNYPIPNITNFSDNK